MASHPLQRAQSVGHPAARLCYLETFTSKASPPAPTYSASSVLWYTLTAHMPVIFANPPLVELIAEFKWSPSNTLNMQAGLSSVPQVVPFIGGSKLEEFFMRLGGELYQLGFQMSERLVPPGFPALPNQAIVRFRSNDPSKSSVLYQVGPGILTVNATPPYRTWREFLPHVERGLRTLLNCRSDSERDQPFTEVSLRYIDLFGDDLTQGKSVVSFMSEVLGISVALPDAIRNLGKSSEVSSLNLIFVLPIPPGTLTLTVADGKAGNRSGVVLITGVTSKHAWQANLDTLMSWLFEAHDIIQDVFMKMTRPIHHLMKPSAEVTQ
jgi:uncharacterized protein (TIGR04255 family)